MLAHYQCVHSKTLNRVLCAFVFVCAQLIVSLEPNKVQSHKIMDAAKMASSAVSREDELQQLAIHAAGNRFPNERRPYGMFSFSIWVVKKKKKLLVGSFVQLSVFLFLPFETIELPPIGSAGSPYQLPPSAAAHHSASAAAMMAHRHLAAAASVKSDPNIKIELENAELWQQFHQIGTEMIITKLGRCVILIPSTGRICFSNSTFDSFENNQTDVSDFESQLERIGSQHEIFCPVGFGPG